MKFVIDRAGDYREHVGDLLPGDTEISTRRPGTACVWYPDEEQGPPIEGEPYVQHGEWLPDLMVAQHDAWEKIKAMRDTRSQAGGYVVDVGGGEFKWFHSDQPSRTQQIALVMLGNSIPPGTMWKTMDGSKVEMTPALAQKIFQAAVQCDLGTFFAAEQHKAAMEASEDPLAYDFTDGWPPIFGE